MLIDGDDDAVHRHVEALRGRGDDAQIGLMRHQPIDRRLFQLVRRQRLFDDGIERLDRDLEHFVAGHHDAHAGVLLVELEARRHADRIEQQFLVRAVGMQVRGQDARLARRLQHDRAGTVTEQHAGAAVGPVEHARQRFGADHQRTFRGPRTHELVGGRQRENETRTSGIDVECGAAVRADAMLHQAGGARKNDVRRGRADDQQVDVAGLHACGFHRTLGRLHREIAGGLPFLGDMALADAGALADPFVGSVDDLFQIGVGDDVVRQVTAGAHDARIDHVPIPG